MPNPYLTDEISEATRSHKQAMTAMQQASRQAGEQGMRAVSLWQTIVSQLSQEEAQAAGVIVMQRAKDMWADALTYQAQAMDALALSTGVTRDDLLNEIKAMPDTFPKQ